MLFQIRNTRGKVVSVEVEENWMLGDLQKAYNAALGAKKYAHHFVAFPGPFLSASSPILQQIRAGKGAILKILIFDIQICSVSVTQASILRTALSSDQLVNI